jgi:multiple sugar transport system substrate-binding protein
MDEITTAPISRRRFLAKTALAAGAAAGTGSLLQFTAPSRAEAAQARDVTTLVVMYAGGEISNQEVKLFEKQHPDIKIRMITADPLRLNAMLAAGQAPDMVREQGAPNMPNLAARGVALNLDPYFATSKLVPPSDLQPVNNVYRWDGKLQGQGPIYGIAKDWSPDAQIWYIKPLFDRAHVKYPSDSEPLHYDELLAMAKKLTVRKGGKIAVYGLTIDLSGDLGFYGQALQMLEQEGTSFYNHDFSEADFTTPAVRKVYKWLVDWGQARVGLSPLDNEPTWAGDLGIAKREAMIQYGYWYHGYIVDYAKDKNLINEVGFIPAPQWGSKRISGTFTATGAYIPAASKHKEAAWKFFEFFGGGVPAVDRAHQGWGIPARKSHFQYLPHTIPADQYVLQQVRNELKHFGVIHFSPYVTRDPVLLVTYKYLAPVMKGKAKLDDALKSMTNDVNKLLRLGKSEMS